MNGSDFTYVNNQLVGGVVTRLAYNVLPDSVQVSLTVDNTSFPAASLGHWVATNASQEALATILARSDDIRGSGPAFGTPSGGSDLIRAYGGDDRIQGGGGADTIYGGAGNDHIIAHGVNDTPGRTYLRGDEGADYIVGGRLFYDINGNMGNDTVSAGLGDDWVVGGKDSDLLFGDDGSDLVYGNLGDDTCVGGDGNDIVRGGQDNDVLFAGAGADYVSGDRGDDTLQGGGGADVFHSFGEAGVDRVIDFSLGQSDRVLLDPGTQYTVAQVGADTVISMAGGGQMVLVGVQLSSLTGAWIVVG